MTQKAGTSAAQPAGRIAGGPPGGQGFFATPVAEAEVTGDQERVPERPPGARQRPVRPGAGPSAIFNAPAAARGGRRPAARRARLTLARVDPWSVLKASLIFTSCLLVVWMVAVIVLYGILTGAGVFDAINQTLSDVLATHINFNGAFVLFGALLLGAFNVVLLSALATVAAFAYNITASLVGGLEVTLAERD